MNRPDIRVGAGRPMSLFDDRKERALEDGNVVDAPRPCPAHGRIRATRIGRRLHYLCCGQDAGEPIAGPTFRWGP